MPPELRGTLFEGPMPSEMETAAQMQQMQQPQGIMQQLLANPNIPMTPAWQDKRLADIKSGNINNEMLLQALTLGSFLGGKPTGPGSLPIANKPINPASHFGMKPGSKTGVMNGPPFKRPANDLESMSARPQGTLKDAPEVASTDLTRNMTPAQEAAEEMAGTFTPRIYQDSPDMKKIMGEVGRHMDDAAKTPTFKSKEQLKKIDDFANGLKARMEGRTNEIINKYVSATKENPHYAKSVIENNQKNIKSAGSPHKPLPKYMDMVLENTAANRNVPRATERKSLENDLAVLKYNQDSGHVKGDANKFSNAQQQQEIKALLDLLNKEK